MAAVFKDRLLGVLARAQARREVGATLVAEFVGRGGRRGARNGDAPRKLLVLDDVLGQLVPHGAQTDLHGGELVQREVTVLYLLQEAVHERGDARSRRLRLPPVRVAGARHADLQQSEVPLRELVRLHGVLGRMHVLHERQEVFARNDRALELFARANRELIVTAEDNLLRARTLVRYDC